MSTENSEVKESKCCSARSPLSQVLRGFSLGAGIAILGYFFQCGWVKVARIALGSKCITAKGLVTRDIKCDRADWQLSFEGTGNDLQHLTEAAKAQRERLQSFLTRKGFQLKDIILDDADLVITDRWADFQASKWNKEPPKHRYRIRWRFLVRTQDVDKVISASGRFFEFKEQNPVDGDLQISSDVTYSLDNLEKYRGDMMAEATTSARKIAERLVEGNKAKVGSLLSADQGSIHLDYRSGSPYRKAELISVFKFEIESK